MCLERLFEVSDDVLKTCRFVGSAPHPAATYQPDIFTVGMACVTSKHKCTHEMLPNCTQADSEEGSTSAISRQQPPQPSPSPLSISAAN